MYMTVFYLYIPIMQYAHYIYTFIYVYYAFSSTHFRNSFISLTIKTQIKQTMCMKPHNLCNKTVFCIYIGIFYRHHYITGA